MGKRSLNALRPWESVYFLVVAQPHDLLREPEYFAGFPADYAAARYMANELAKTLTEQGYQYIRLFKVVGDIEGKLVRPASRVASIGVKGGEIIEVERLPFESWEQLTR